MKQITLFLGILLLSNQASGQDYIPIPGSSPGQASIIVYGQTRGCGDQDQVPEAFTFDDVPESLLKTHVLHIEWTPPLKGRWQRTKAKQWVWTRTTKIKPLQRYQAKIFPRKRGSPLSPPSNPIVYNFKNTLTLCSLNMDILSGDLVRINFESSLEMEGKDLAPFVTFSIAGKTKTARWTTMQGFQQAVAELELVDAELSEMLDVTIKKTITFAGQSIQLPKAYHPRFELPLLKEHQQAAQVRVPAAELNTKKGVKETCDRVYDLNDMYKPGMICYYNGEAFTGTQPEAMSLLTAAQCKKGRPVIDRYVKCVESDSFSYDLLVDK